MDLPNNIKRNLLVIMQKSKLWNHYKHNCANKISVHLSITFSWSICIYKHQMWLNFNSNLISGCLLNFLKKITLWCCSETESKSTKIKLTVTYQVRWLYTVGKREPFMNCWFPTPGQNLCIRENSDTFLSKHSNEAPLID